MFDNRKARRARQVVSKSDRRTSAAARRAAAMTATVGTAAALTAALTTPAAPAESPVARSLEVALAGLALGAATADEAAPAEDCGSDGKELCQVPPALTTGGWMGVLTAALNLTGSNPLYLSKELNVGFTFANRNFSSGIYEYVDELPYGPKGRWACAQSPTADCRQVSIISYGFEALGLADAQRELFSAAEKGTLTAPGGGKPGTTILNSFIINNPLNPDGGIVTRFAPLLESLGIDTSLQPAGLVSSPSPTGTSLSNSLWNFNTPYNPLSDFPITLNPFSMLNTLAANTLPIGDLISQFQYPGTEISVLPPDGIWNNVAGSYISPPNVYDLNAGGPTNAMLRPGIVAFGPKDTVAGLFGELLQSLSGNQDPVFNPLFLTLAATNYLPSDSNPAQGCPNGDDKCPQNTTLPMLYPTQILPSVVNLLLGAVKSPYLLGNPVGDVLAPALRILVNIGYNDVVTPEMLNTVDPIGLSGTTYAKENYRAYDRTFYQATPGEPTPFGWFTNPAMTAEQTQAAYGAAWSAFTDALQAQFAKPFWGILVPNPANPPAAPSASKAAAKSPAPVLSEAQAAEPAAPEPVPASVADSLVVGSGAVAAPAVVAPDPVAPDPVVQDDDPAEVADPVARLSADETNLAVVTVEEASSAVGTVEETDSAAITGDHSDDDTGRSGGKNRRGAR
jgi:hypothetical protein